MADDNEQAANPQENQPPPENPVETPPPSPPTDTETQVPEPGQNAKTMAMLCHLLPIFVGFLAPLIIWLVKKDEDPFIDEQGKEALNFQITVMIAMTISSVLMLARIGFVLAPAVGIANIVFCIIATIKTLNGEHYRYPWTYRFIK